MTDPKLIDPLLELLAQAEEINRLAEEIRRAADRIAARRHDDSEGAGDDRPDQ